jgi:hypothetical protein
LYDPSGSYVPTGSGRGSGDYFEGAEADLQAYLSYQSGSGSAVETYVFNTTPEEEAAIAAAAREQGAGGFLGCAVSVSSAVSGVPRFSGIKAATPSGLASQLGALQNKSK